MDELALRELIGEVRIGRLSRRHFVQGLAGLGLTAPIAAQLLDITPWGSNLWNLASWTREA
jgi:hypothetical protein